MNEIRKNEGQNKGLKIVSPETGLTALQERCAQLIASGTRITEIADELPVCKATIYKWLRSDLFCCYLNLMKQELKDSIEGCVIGLKDKALEGLKASLESDNEQVRLKAATWVIDRLAAQEVGETDARKLLKARAEERQAQNDWTAGQVEAKYQEELLKAGLEE